MWRDLWHTQATWDYYTERSTNYCLSMRNGRCYWPRGKVLGGCSAINGNLYIRGNRNNFDTWLKLGNPTWGWHDNVLNYYKKSEQCLVPELLSFDNGKYHSADGLLKVTHYKTIDPMRSVLKHAARELGLPWLPNLDVKFIGLVRMIGTFDDPARDSAAKAFLISAKHRSNLHIVYNAHVLKILFDKHGSAVGVEFMLNGKHIVARQRKEIIVSAGAINSPQLLMLSGLGDREKLRKLNIPTVRHVPGIGQSLQDHAQIPVIFEIKRPTEFSRIKDDPMRNMFEYITNGTGKLTSAGFFDIASYFNSINTTDPFPNIQTICVHLQKGSNGLATFFRTTGFEETLARRIEERTKDSEIFMFLMVMITPKSRGELNLNSADPFDHPAIDAGYFSDRMDLRAMVEGVKFLRKLVQTKSFREHQIEEFIVPLDACGEHGSDSYWECYIRHLTFSVYHPVGTVRMGPNTDKSAVVDYRLRVKEIPGLRVIDASIMPIITSGNTNAPSIMIGEKGSAFIKEDWRDEGEREITKKDGVPEFSGDTLK